MALVGETTLLLPGELLRRTSKPTRVKVVRVRGDGGEAHLPKGAIAVVSGRPGSPLLAAVERAARRKDATGVAAAIRAHQESLRKPKRRTLKKGRPPPARGRSAARRRSPQTVAEALAGIPAITQVEYKGKTIAEALVVAQGLDAMNVLLPYAGAKLDPRGFRATTFRPKGVREESVSTIVVVRAPQLSALEKKIVAKIPAEEVAGSIGPADRVANWGLAAAGLVLAGVWVAGAYLADYAADKVAEDRQEQEKQVEQDIAGDDAADDDAGDDQADDAGADVDYEADDEGEDVDDDEDEDGERYRRWDDWLTLDRNRQILTRLDPKVAVGTLVRARSKLVMKRVLR